MCGSCSPSQVMNDNSQCDYLSWDLRSHGCVIPCDQPLTTDMSSSLSYVRPGTDRNLGCPPHICQDSLYSFSHSIWGNLRHFTSSSSFQPWLLRVPFSALRVVLGSSFPSTCVRASMSSPANGGYIVLSKMTGLQISMEDIFSHSLRDVWQSCF